MTHPLIPQLIDLATPVAENLGLEVVGAVFTPTDAHLYCVWISATAMVKPV